MSGFAQKVEAAFAGKQSRVLVVPEWDGQELHVFPLTIVELKAIQKEDDAFMRAARIVQVRAKDAEARRVFDEADFVAITTRGIGKYGPAVVARVAGEIMADLPTPENAEKN